MVIFTKDQRHSIKSDFRVQNVRGVKIFAHTITNDFVRRLCRKIRIWERLDFICGESELLNLFDCYGKDPMNVPNALKFFKVCAALIKCTDELKECCSQSDTRMLGEFAVFTELATSCIATLFERDGTWSDRGRNAALSAFGVQFFFNKNDCRELLRETTNLKGHLPVGV